ncbi:hypothetical protein DRJ23_02170 [Candidatus Acetothermia bacterium]|nr:MAG: hypothetical protein DRJ23_02170 [Candidatus Acetothermia bacterium]
MDRVGTRLKQSRLAHGRSKRRTAAELEVSSPSIIRWEEGESEPNDYNRFKIEALLAARTREADRVR